MDLQSHECTKNTIQSQTETSDYLNYYLSVNVDNICRICLEKGNKLMPIFDPVKPAHFSIIIMSCASVQVVEGDGLPSHICQKCISKLNLAFQFKTQCETADAKLRKSLQHSQNIFIGQNNETVGPVSIIFTEDNSVKENIQKNAYSSNINGIQERGQLDSLSSPETISKTQLEPLQNVPLDAFSVVSTTETDLKIKFIKQQEPNIKTNDIALVLSENKTVESVAKDHKCGFCGKGFSKKNGLVHHIRIHTGERPYVCHLCDKRFINGGHLHTHMRTHTGEKKHVCAACSKAFATAQQLTKHTIAIHTSERPYACTYCPRRFASSSNLNTHTKIHTGEKNYYCDQCGKAFSTKGQLYQHMLVHTGEKAFLCEFCNKRFSQKAHLVRHLKMHNSL